jgi:hypothetical protein
MLLGVVACSNAAVDDEEEMTPTPVGERYLVTMGGYCDNAVYMARVSDDETLDPWTTETTYPLVYGAQGLHAVGDCVVSTGGYICSTSGPTAETYTARVVDGAIGPWQAQPSLPRAVFTNTLVADGSTLYSMGGWAPDADAVYKAELDSSCNLSAWSVIESLPVPRDFAGAIIHDGFAWLVGGAGGNYQPRTEVYYGEVDAEGPGGWQFTTPLPPPGRFGHGIAVHENRIFVVGGADTVGPTDTVYVAEIAADGSVGEWSTTTPLPSARWFLAVTATADTLYVVGGGSSGAENSTVWSAPFTEDGIGSFTTLESMPGPLQDNRATLVAIR